jgi:hypothetical protein
MDFTKKANVFSGVWLISLIVLVMVVTHESFSGNIWDGENYLAASIFVLHGISFFLALWFYAKDKGYPGILGVALGLLYGLGLLIMLLLPNKRNNQDGEVDPDGVHNQELIDKQKMPSWFLIVISIATLWYFADYSNTRFPAVLGGLLGFTMAGSLVILAAISLIPVIRRKTSMILIFSTVMIATSGYKSFQLFNKGSELHESVSSISNMIDDSVNGKKVEQVDSSAPGFLKVLNNSVVRAQNIDGEFLKKINKASLETILSPESLVDPNSLSKSIKAIDRLMIAANYFEKERLENVELTVEELLAIDTDRAKDAYTGYVSSKPKRVKFIEDYYGVQKGTLLAMKDIVIFAEQKAGTFEISDGQLFFSTDQDVISYNNLYDRLMYFVNREQELIKQAQADSLAGKEKLRSLKSK